MKIESIKTKGFAISLIAFPVMLLTGFLMHPDLLKLEALKTVEQLAGRFHNKPIYHIGYLIVMFTVPVIIIALTSFMNVLQGKGKQLGFWGIRILRGRMKCSSTACPIYDTKKNQDLKCLQPCG